MSVVLRVRMPTFSCVNLIEGDFQDFEKKRFFRVMFSPLGPFCACCIMRVSFRTSRSSCGWVYPNFFTDFFVDTEDQMLGRVVEAAWSARWACSNDREAGVGFVV
jgi:hypothetical protein